jgi:hypothetical protein
MGIAVGEGGGEAFLREQRADGSLNKQGPDVAARYGRLTTGRLHPHPHAHDDYEAWCIVGVYPVCLVAAVTQCFVLDSGAVGCELGCGALQPRRDKNMTLKRRDRSATRPAYSVY